MKTFIRFLPLLLLSGISGIVLGAPKKQSPQKSPSATAAAPLSADRSLLSVDGAPSAFRNRVLEGFRKLYERGVAEKLYLLTDKPYYSAGENVWFKGFLVNGTTLAPAAATNYIYVELIDGTEALKQRVKIKAGDFGFHNALKLPADLPEGEYALRAYTRWMENEEPEFFFTRVIRVANPIDDRMLSTIEYSHNEDGTIQATVRLTNSFLEPVKRRSLSCTRQFGGRDRSFTARTDDNGVARFSFTPPADSVRGSIRIAIPDEDNPFDRTFQIPMFAPDFDVQFFPEGGHLLPGHLQQVACKAIGTNGLGLEVSGTIFMSGGTQIGEFSSQHLGMGKFSLLPVVGERYYAEVTSKSGLTKRFDLPAVAATGCTLQVVQQGSRLFCQITVTPDLNPDRLGLVVHSKGGLVIAEELKAGQLLKSIQMEQLPEGVLTLAVIDRQTNTPLSERLCFVWHGAQARGAVTPDKKSYGRRELVTLTLQVTDSEGAPAGGTFALSVTDRNTVQCDSLEDNILSNLLLTSDIKGNVERPGYYFLDRDAERMSHLDLLMMTQGWRRFDLSEVLKGELKPYSFRQERYQSISGEIKGFFGNAAKNTQLLFAIPKERYFNLFPLDKENRFTLSDLDFADSTMFFLQAQRRERGATRTLSLNIKAEKFPETKAFIPRPSLGNMPPAIPETYVEQARQQYFYEGGMPVIDLRAITVTGTRKNDNMPIEYRGNVFDTYTLPSQTLASLGSAPLSTVITQLPGVHLGIPRRTSSDSEDIPDSTPSLVPMRGSREVPIHLDQFHYEYNELPAMTAQDIESISLLNVFGRNGTTGYAIYIHSKPGWSIVPNPSIARIQPLGYKKPVAFYQPKYEVASVRNNRIPDLRTTICWNPEIRTDASGMAKVTFYTADQAVPYEIVLEGVTDDGQLCRTVAILERK